MTNYAARRTRRPRRRVDDTQRLHNPSPPNTLARNELTPQQENVLQLQRTIGNRATQQVLGRLPSATIQRLPSPLMVRQVMGEARKDKTFRGKVISRQSTHYKAVLAALDTYNQFVLNQPASMTTLDGLMQVLDGVKTAVEGYLTGKSKRWKSNNKDKVAYMQQMLGMIASEKATAVLVATRYSRTPLYQTPKWYIALSSNAPKSNLIEESQVTGQVGGGTNVLDTVNVGGKAGFFKENLDIIPNKNVVEGAGQNIRKELAGTGLENKPANALTNLENVSEMAGITFDMSEYVDYNSVQGLQEGYKRFGGYRQGGFDFAKRDIAMSRLNELLGGGVIARAEKALKKTGNEVKQGSLMDKAKGRQIDKLNFSDTAQGKNAPSIYDPNLQRMLSRLQLLDALAFQVDRNMSNFFIQTDQTGKVIAVTGIDNDMSFGKYAHGIGRQFNYPGTSRFVDAELARKILNLDPKMLDWALGDLLSESELEALKIRLDKLKAHLQDLESKGELLEPDEWDQATAKGMLAEKSSYYETMIYQLVRAKKIPKPS